MRLKTELHQIIGLCAALAFIGIGLTAFWSVRHFHRVEYVQARGELLGRVLTTSCVEKLEGPSPVPDLKKYLDRLVRSTGQEDLDMVSAVIYDRERQVVVDRGRTSKAHDPGEPHVVRAFEATDPEAVEIESGEVFERWSKTGEEIVEFALPLINDDGEHLGVLVFSLARGGAREAFFRTMLLMFLVGAAAIAILWFILFKMLKDRILMPILQLSEGITKVRAGDLTARVEIYRRDEIGTLVESFNDLIAVLVERDSLQARLEEANRLEEAHRKLEEAHQQLKAAHEQLMITEKHASIGRLVHGLNHELNNPLSAAQNMIPPLKAALDELREVLTQPEAAPPAVEADQELESSTVSDRLEAEFETHKEEVKDKEKAAADESEAEPALAEERGEKGQPKREPAPPLPEPEPEPESTPTPSPEIAENLDDAAQAVEVLARSVRRAINIVHDLGAFSKLTTADLETVALRDVINEAITNCDRELGPDGRVKVVLDIPEADGEPLTLKAFPNLLGQVFVNLITNSAQAIEGSGRIRIWAKLLGDDRVRIELDDNGPGIPKDNLTKVFEPFFTTKEQGKGSGLGLALCLGIVQKHGGTIGVKKRWRGAHFVVELPLKPVLEPKDPFGSAAFRSAGATTVLG